MVYERSDAAMHGERVGFQCVDGVNQGSPWKDGELSLLLPWTKAFRMEHETQWKGGWDSTAVRRRQEDVVMTWRGREFLTREE